MAVAALGCQKDEGITATIPGPGGPGTAMGTGGMLSDGTVGTGGSSGAGGNMDAGAGGAIVAGSGGATDAGPETAMDAPSPVDTGPEAPALGGYKGRPWNNTPQAVPGMIQASLYDIGGEGIAYHDADTANNGAVQAKATTPTLAEATFRSDEAVDLRTTRAGSDRYDNGSDLQAGQLYVGWTQSGEWINYTIDVKETAHYIVSALVATLTDGTRMTFLLEDGTNTGPRALPWTHSYMAWHFAQVGTLDLTAGLHVLTMRLETPSVNVLYISLQKG